MVEHNDIAGKKIKPGSFIIYAAQWGRCATLKYGVVTRLASREDFRRGKRQEIPTLRVVTVDRDFDDKWELQKKGKESALSFLDRLLVVPPDMVPDDALSLLHDVPIPKEK